MASSRYTICLYGVAFLLVGLLWALIPSSVSAASLKFDKGTVTVSPGSTFTIDAVVDAGSDQITSADMWVLYDPTLLEAQSASSGAYFPAVTNNLTTAGKAYIAGLISNPGDFKTGIGSVATITFKALKNGTATLSYDCRTDVSNSSKIIKNSVDTTNVINCATNGTSIVTIGTGGPTGVPTQAPLVTSYYSNQQTPSTLPRSGIADDMPKLMTFGGILVAVGIAMRLLLLL